MAVALKWSWQYFRREVDWYDDADDALLAAMAASDAGTESFDVIEVWDDDGYRRLGIDAVDAYRAEYNARMAETFPERPAVCTLSFLDTTRDGAPEWVVWSPYDDADKAAAALAQLAPVLGDRVKVEAIQ